MFIKSTSETKKAFTLIELIISIILLGLIVTFLYSSIANLQKSNTIFSKKDKASAKELKILSLIYDDIFEAVELNITKQKPFDTIDLMSKNSLFDIEYPYITWLVSKDDNYLLRIESTKKFKNVSSEDINLFHITKIESDCEAFQIFQSNKKENILLYIKFKDKKPIIYEFFKPLNTNRSKKR